MRDVSRSQRGGIAAWQGLDYQKKIIAYLAIGILSSGSKIIRITCEDLDDIKVEEESKIIYYQVKSTSSRTLSPADIHKSIQLFSTIESNITHTKRTEYVLTSSARIKNLPDNMGIHSFSKLDKNTRENIMALDGVRSRSSFLDRVYFFKGPVLQEMSAVLTDHIFAVLKNYGYDNIEGIKNDLLRRISDMCPGRVDLKDNPMVDSDMAERLDMEHKSINPNFIKKIVEDNKPDTIKKIVEDDRPISTPQGRILVSNELISKYKIMPTHLDKEKLKKVHQFLEEYDSLHNDDLRITYLQKFNDFSKRFNLYSDTKFLDFLEKQIKNGTNQHVVLECRFKLHSLILSS
jgi:hypothetical protein